MEYYKNLADMNAWANEKFRIVLSALQMEQLQLKTPYGSLLDLLCHTFDAAEVLASKGIDEARVAAKRRLQESMDKRERDLGRQHARDVARTNPTTEAQKVELDARHETARAEVAMEGQRVEAALDHARPRLVAAVAVRLMKAKHVSG